MEKKQLKKVGKNILKGVIYLIIPIIIELLFSKKVILEKSTLIRLAMLYGIEILYFGYFIINKYKEKIKKQSQQTKVIFIIGGLVTMFLFIYTVMYISNRNKKTHIHWQQLLMKNQTEKATLKEEIRALSHANEINEHRYADILNQRIKLWHQSLQICVRLFKTTTSYKKIQSIETSKNKKEKEITQEELSLIYQEINEAFIEAMQELLEQYPSLTQDDLYYCILNYLQLSNNTIKVCMKAGSQSALTKRKYRIKKQLSDLSFSIIFDAKGESK